MKKIMLLILVLSMGVVHADIVSPLPTVKNNLEEMLKVSAGRKNFNEMKIIANDKNTDVDVAFENYLIAKKNVSIARAQFNPITTGHLLGVSLGLTYLWAPVAIEAVLSIPTKIYNVSKNKYLSKVATYNLYEAREVLNNELAHLYYDILTHEVILKTIDQEIQILTYQEAKWTERKFSADRLADLKKWILRLGKEHVDIYNMYLSELAAIRTLVSTTKGSSYELAQVSALLDKSIIANLDQSKLQSFAVVNSNQYKAAINLDHASEANIKQVQWSILSWSGINFSYKSRVREARNEENISSLRKESTEKEVKTNVLLQLQKFDSSLDILSNYNSISQESLQVYSDTYETFLLGQLSEDAAIQAALGAIRDYRSKVVAHYSSWSSLNDLSKSASFDFKATSSLQEKSAQNQLESNSLYQLDQDSFKIVKNEDRNSFSLALSSPSNSAVANVDYIFANNELANRSSDYAKKNFVVNIQVDDLPETVTGVAIVRLLNGHEFNIKFNL
ncbi:MAG: hypothetical protein Q7U04_10880 [Bacteriovorax sp.]|nr:hypothetical protein [Bacteriovorax sp.]